MKQRVQQIFRNQFLKNVSTLAFGTLISQGLVVASSPLLTRIFSVEAFGILSVFTSITVFFAVVSTGRYELAIGLPEKDKDALKKALLNFEKLAYGKETFSKLVVNMSCYLSFYIREK